MMMGGPPGRNGWQVSVYHTAVLTDRIVVLEFQDELVGLLVTAVTDVVTLDGPQIEPPTRGLRDRIGMGIARTSGAPPTVLLDARVVFD